MDELRVVQHEDGSVSVFRGKVEVWVEIFEGRLHVHCYQPNEEENEGMPVINLSYVDESWRIGHYPAAPEEKK